ncbi:MAG: FKBP-type peptidyl-prolyl cis-trans isomerase [Candidatus Thermoplasmatota archaeon]|nr:FKBP-type peptidyl-prolyl cis-trans isomerase [Candidatus Thermoplasmatota archaeon]MED6305728.1 FKBP-type peptidyl-prolyl cis-trans isomerase [Candidatus Thermoplasmatota archaeon]
MARRVRRKKGTPKAAIPTYREEGVKASRPDTRPALIALLLVILLIGSALYFTSMVEEPTAVEYGVEAELLTNMHNTEAGYDTDFVLIVKNTGSIADTFDIGVKRNDGGFLITIEEGYESITLDKNKKKPILVNVKTSASSSGLLSSTMEVKSRGDGSQSVDVKLDVNTDYAFGNQSSIGDAVKVHYAGILARNADLFDSSMVDIWDNYEYRKSGVTDSNRHTDTLAASNIGCDSPDTHENCDGSRGMIPGFDAKMVGMYEGQSLAVRIPAKDAYGETGTSELVGEDLIFTIVMVSID